MSNRRLQKLVDYFNVLFDTVYHEDSYNATKVARVVAVMVQTMTLSEAREFVFNLLGMKGKELKINRDPIARKVECNRFMRLVLEKYPRLYTDGQVYDFFKQAEFGLSDEDLRYIEDIEIANDDQRKISYADAVKKYDLNRNTFKTKVRELNIKVFEKNGRKSIYEQDIKKIIEAIGR